MKDVYRKPDALEAQMFDLNTDSETLPIPRLITKCEIWLSRVIQKGQHIGHLKQTGVATMMGL